MRSPKPRSPSVLATTSTLLLLLLASTAVVASSSVSASTATTTAKTKAKSDKILLSRIRSLTLRHGQMTTSRRVSPIPQLRYKGCGWMEWLILVLRINSVSWSCEATLPHFFKLGATDVICEGYSSSDDPFVLKGSCGVEYILMLTEAGHKKFPKTEEQIKEEEKVVEEEKKKVEEEAKSSTSWSGMIEFILWLVSIVGFFAFIAYRAYKAPEHPPGGAWAGDGWGPGGGGGGGGPGDGWGGGGGGDNWRGYRDEPPPPYDDRYAKPRPSTSRRTTSSSYARQHQAPHQEQWRPGFWTGAATGAAASYVVNNAGTGMRGQSSSSRRESYERERERERLRRYSAGPGGWRSSSYGGSSYEGDSSTSAAAYEHPSTGFGQTRRR
ncbi:hypothetical protein ABW21_db0204668 [Orbilia brochopaga]|nr:hypothetical protein ABW21_db0204668 [Drechslerella brochopaga]